MTIRVRRDTSTNWSTVNPVLADGQPGYDVTTRAYKIGNGVTAWNSLQGISAVAAAAWGSITGTLSAQTDLQTALNGKANTSSFTAFGLSLGGSADAAAARTTLGLGTAATSNTGDFAASSHTQALSTISDVTITAGNLNSLDDGVNTALHFHDSDRARANHTGTQLASTISDFSTAADARISAAVGVSVQGFDGDLASIAALAGTSGLARKTAANTWSLDTATYITGNQTITFSGDATGSGATAVTLTIPNGTVTLAKQANLAANSIQGNNTGVAATPIALTAAQVKTLLAIAPSDVSGLAAIATSGSAADLAAGTVPAARMPALTGDVTTTAGTVATTIAAGAVTLAKQANLAANSIIGNNTASSAPPLALTTTQVRTLINVADGATANSSDATLLARANHTGTQAASTITGLATVATSGSAADLSAGTLLAARLPALTGDVTSTAGTAATTIAASAVTNAKLANVATATFKGRVTAAAGAVEDLTGTQATTLLDAFTSTLKGLAPASGGGTTNFLRADGTWAAPAGGAGEANTASNVNVGGVGVFKQKTGVNLEFRGINAGSTKVTITSDTVNNEIDVDVAEANLTLGNLGGSIDLSTAKASGTLAAARFPALTGDVTTTAGAVATTVANGAVTLAKMANLAANSIIGNNTGVAAAPVALTAAQAKALLAIAVADVSGLATIATSGSATDLAAGTVAAARMPAHTGDVTSAAGSVALTVAANAVTNAKSAQMAASTFKGNATGATADPQDMTATQATALLNTFTSALKGLVPASGGGTTTFLRADGTFAAPGGGGAPGGATGQIQFNSAGAFAGATFVEIEGNHLRLDDVTNPAAPASGALKLYSSNVGGYSHPAFRAPTGLEQLLMPHMGRGRVAMWHATGNGTGITAVDAAALTITGTATAANQASTNRYTSTRRVESLVTVAATTAVAGWRAPAAMWWRGNAAGLGGFLYIQRWGTATGVATTTNRAFVGMAAATAAPTDVEPSSITDILGMGWDAADANIQVFNNDSTGVAVKTDLGASFVVPTTDRASMYELAMYCAPNASSITWAVTDLISGATASGTFSADIPAAATFLAPRLVMSVGGTSSVIGITFASLTINSFY